MLPQSGLLVKKMGLKVCACVHVSVSVYVCVRVCTFVYVHICLHTLVYVCVLSMSLTNIWTVWEYIPKRCHFWTSKCSKSS